MKITVTDKSYDEVMALPKRKHIKPKKPNIFWRTVLKIASTPAMMKSHFKCEKVGMEKLKKNEPALVLMNHSGFIDMEIVAASLYPRPFNIVTTSDAFIGLDWILRQIGCIPTNKFTSDANLVRDIMHVTRKLKSSVVIYPEASYSFDGTHTEMGDSTGKLIKMLKIPVVMIRTYGAFHHTPLYNNLHVRNNTVTATMTYLLSPEQIAEMSVEEINAVVDEQFNYDHFAWQRDNRIVEDHPERADMLNRALYKCPHCNVEGKMEGKGITLTCNACGKVYTMDEYGQLKANEGETEFPHIPDWYRWERECVRREIEQGEYILDTDVDILMTVDTKKLYRVGSGHLTHTAEGFVLDGCDGKLHYEHKPLCSHSLYSDFYWYEIDDVICIGNQDYMYYCFPKIKGDVVAKTRMAAEEIYKIKRAEKEAASKNA